MKLLRKDILKATGSIQLCAGQDAGSEAAIHSVYDMLNEDNTEAVLMVDVWNAFNSFNREAFPHNTKVLCPALATFVNNCYSIPSDLFFQMFKINRENHTGKPSSNGITPLKELHHC